MKTTISPQEIDKFSRIADEWWDLNGKFKPLHAFNPIRLHYIRHHIEAKMNNLNGLNVLDIGCGGGLLCEPMARLGVNVTGADASEKNIKTAMLHAEKSGLNIDYLVTSAEEVAVERPAFYDVILNMEVIEHVADTHLFIEACFKMLKPNGLMFIATLNRTLKSYLFGIIGAEYILRWLPVGTHDWKKFLTPTELHTLCTPYATLIHRAGASFNPIKQEWSQTNDLNINYMTVYEKNR